MEVDNLSRMNELSKYRTRKIEEKKSLKEKILIDGAVIFILRSNKVEFLPVTNKNQPRRKCIPNLRTGRDNGPYSTTTANVSEKSQSA